MLEVQTPAEQRPSTGEPAVSEIESHLLTNIGLQRTPKNVYGIVLTPLEQMLHFLIVVIKSYYNLTFFKILVNNNTQSVP